MPAAIAARGLPAPIAVTITLAVLGLALLVWFLAARSVGPADSSVQSAPTGQTAPPRQAGPDSTSPPPDPTRGKPAASAPERSPTEDRRAPRPTGTARQLEVIEARLCAPLSTGTTWRCVEPGNPVGAGVIYFYTRLASPRDTEVQHRWYRGGLLHQSVSLDVAANAGAGYRTFSRRTITGDLVGDWRVELRSADGTLLEERRFVVK